MPKTEFEPEDAEIVDSLKVDSGKRTKRNSSLSTAHYPLSTLSDKWILSRANRTARDIRAAFDKYEINEVTKLLYDFIWRDYCDWYLEIVKIQPESIPLAVEILEGILRMLHPIMPFVTEELWHALTGEPESVLIGRDDYITADEGKIDDKAEEEFGNIQKVIAEIRTNVPPKRKVKGIRIEVYDNSIRELLDLNRALIAKFAMIHQDVIVVEFKSNANFHMGFDWTNYVIPSIGELHILCADLTNADRLAEIPKVIKELERTVKMLQQSEAKLKNESFKTKAPKEILEAEEAKFQSLKLQHDALVKTMNDLGVPI